MTAKGVSSMTTGRRKAQMQCALLAVALSGVAACGATTPPVVAGAPHYPDFVLPTLTSPDPRLEKIGRDHQAAWQMLQAGDVDRAAREFQNIVKKSPAFYPSQAALAYVELARHNYEPAVAGFDEALKEHADYVPALVGKGQALLALSRDADALRTFEAALHADPTLTDVARRVEVLRAKAEQENVAAARAAAQAGRLDEAVAAYGRAIAASPDSAFLYRDLADVETRQKNTDAALAHYRKAVELDPSDAASRIHIAEALEARDDVEGALAAYREAAAIDSTPDVKGRIAALEARAAYLKLPVEYRTLDQQPTLTRGDLAALIGIRLAPLLATAPPQPVLVTDTRGHWAEQWILEVTRAGIMSPYDNHTFGGSDVIRRSDLARVVSRLLKLIAANDPALLRQWQGKQAKMADVGVSNLNYADVSLAVSSGVLSLAPDDSFQLTRPVTGAEAIDAVNRLERLYNANK